MINIGELELKAKNYKDANRYLTNALKVKSSDLKAKELLDQLHKEIEGKKDIILN